MCSAGGMRADVQTGLEFVGSPGAESAKEAVVVTDPGADSEPWVPDLGAR